MSRLDERQRVHDRLSALRMLSGSPPVRSPLARRRPAGGTETPAEPGTEVQTGALARAGGATAVAGDLDGAADHSGTNPAAERSDSPAALTPEWLTPPAVGNGRLALLPERLRGMRVGLSRRGAAALAVFGLCTALAAGALVWRDRPVVAPAPPVAMAGAAASTKVGAEPPPGELVVSVAGLVRRPGLVRLPPGARVADALAAVGGSADGADLLALNMAARVADGQQIVVLARGQAPPPGGPPAPPPAGQHPAAPAAGKLDLNTATSEQFNALPGVGPVTAAAIIAWRTKNGRFTAADQLGEVDGIGPARLARLRPLVTV